MERGGTWNNVEGHWLPPGIWFEGRGGLCGERLPARPGCPGLAPALRSPSAGCHRPAVPPLTILLFRGISAVLF